MGQAKQRGTRDQRLAQKLGLVERTLDDLKNQLNIPAEAEFLGYGIHLEASDEFLSKFDENPGVTQKIWAKTPELAMLFMDFSGAYNMARKCPGSVVVGIFDSESQVWVAVAQHLTTTG